MVSFCRCPHSGQVSTERVRARRGRRYGSNPYAGYDRIDQIPFLLGVKPDERLPPMERVLSVKNRLYPLSLLERRIDGRTLTFEFRDGRYVDRETGSAWNILGEAVAGPLKGRRLPSIDAGIHFAFAWLAFNPQSEIVRTLP